jgi:Fur family zinc uptake transcriptional regulator
MQSITDMTRSPDNGLAFQPPDHDHDACVADALGAAAAVCRRRGARLTAQRRRVLEIVWASHEPIGAYAIMEQLGGGGRRAAPPTVYRALEFLAAHGLVHRIESLNAYVGCARPGDGHTGRFLLCEKCGSAAEIESSGIDKGIARAARDRGFSVHRATVEILGICPNCHPAPHAPGAAP